MITSNFEGGKINYLIAYDVLNDKCENSKRIVGRAQLFSQVCTVADAYQWAGHLLRMH